MNTRQKIDRPARRCNICLNMEAPRRLNEKDKNVYCFGHVGIHYSVWNLTPTYDAHGNKIPCFRDYQRYLAHKKERLGQSIQGIDVNAPAPKPDEPFVLAEMSANEMEGENR